MPYQTKDINKEWKDRQGRKPGPDCTCLNRCSERLGREAIEIICKKFWALKNYDLQNSDLAKKIDREPTKNQILKGDDNASRVKAMNAYFINYQGQRIRVCKTAFVSSHGIHKSRIETVNLKRTDDTDTVIPDQRGRTGHHNAISEERKSVVCEHIESLPTRSSHYTRDKNPFRKYIDLPEKKSFEWFYYKYVEWSKVHYPHIQIVRLSYYRHIWDTCYNIETKSPRVDTCDACTLLRLKITQLKADGKDATEPERQLEEHLEKANVAYQHLKDAREKKIWKPDEWIIICMDLQKTFLIPQTNTGKHYYLRKVNLYNFNITDVKTGIPYFYIWAEYDGGKGSAEIYSCIYKWLQANVFNKQNRPRKIRIIADNCGGMNK